MDKQLYDIAIAFTCKANEYLKENYSEALDVIVGRAHECKQHESGVLYIAYNSGRSLFSKIEKGLKNLSEDQYVYIRISHSDPKTDIFKGTWKSPWNIRKIAKYELNIHHELLY